MYTATASQKRAAEIAYSELGDWYKACLAMLGYALLDTLFTARANLA